MANKEIIEQSAVKFVQKTTFEWWSEIWLPAIGVIAIPLLIWGLTWFFGAGRAERKKQEQELQNSLNFLSSVCLSTLVDLLGLKKSVEEQQKAISDVLAYILLNNTEKMLEKEASQEQFADFWKKAKLIFQSMVFLDTFSEIIPEKYSSIINYQDSFVIYLIRVQKSCRLLSVKLENRNDGIKSFTPSMDMLSPSTQLASRCFLDAQQSNMPNWHAHICELILDLKKLIDNIQIVKNHCKNLKLDTVNFTEDQKIAINEIEEAKEQK